MSISPLSSLTNALGSGSSSSSNSSSSSAAGGTGLGQGIDIQQFVQFAVANEQATITSLQNQQNNLTAQQSELGTITSQFLTLESAAYALKDPLVRYERGDRIIFELLDADGKRIVHRDAKLAYRFDQQLGHYVFLLHRLRGYQQHRVS